MTKSPTILAALLAGVLLAGCSDNADQATTSSTVPDPAPRVDTDPTPPSGTGGGTEAISPDGTSNGVPAQTDQQQ